MSEAAWLKNTSSQKIDWVFKHDWLEKFDFPKKDVDGKRVYVTPIGELPSVTTALSCLTKKHIDEWKDNIGESRANEIANRQARSGTDVHKLIEKFVKNDDSWRKMMPTTISRAKPLLPILKERLGLVYGTEYPLYSRELHSAGTADIMGLFDKINTIVDIKTSRYCKSRDKIKNYFVQATSYAIMCKELYGIQFSQIAILIAVNEDQPQVFVEKTADWEDKTRLFFRGYQKGKFNA